MRLALPAGVILLALAGVWAMLARGDASPPGAASPRAVARLLAWSPQREAELVARAARGTRRGLYVLSPGGVEVSAARTARWRELVEAAARTAGVRADALEGLVLLESAGRPDAVTPAGLEGAVGLGQILAQTGSGLLGMRVDLTASRRLSARIARAAARGDTARVAALARRRAAVDQRFDPRASLQATARYLAQARGRFGREDLALVSYHMGQGNLEGVLRAYAGRPDGAIADVVRAAGLSYARVYFDSTPARHAAAWRRLASFGDDSANYLWKVHAGEEIMRLWRTDRGQLRRLATLQGTAGSAELVLHPPARTPRYADADVLRAAWDDGALAPLPARPATSGLRVDRRMGAGAPEPALERGLRPPALAVARAIGTQVRTLSGGGTLTLTATVRPASAPGGGEGPSATAMHATGWTFDVARRYVSPAQAQAFQFILDRLQVLDAIAWEREGGVIHVTAAG